MGWLGNFVGLGGFGGERNCNCTDLLICGWGICGGYVEYDGVVGSVGVAGYVCATRNIERNGCISWWQEFNMESYDIPW